MTGRATWASICMLVAVAACRKEAPAPDDGVPVWPTVTVPAGWATVGCNAHVASRYLSRREHELEAASCVERDPPGRRWISSFTIDRDPVIWDDYRRCVAARACPEDLTAQEAGPRARASVAVAGASAVCAWRGMRLPSAAEWSKAVRGDDGQPYPWGSVPAFWMAATGQQFSRSLVNHDDDKSPYGVLGAWSSEWELVADLPMGGREARWTSDGGFSFTEYPTYVVATPVWGTLAVTDRDGTLVDPVQVGQWRDLAPQHEVAAFDQSLATHGPAIRAGVVAFGADPHAGLVRDIGVRTSGPFRCARSADGPPPPAGVPALEPRVAYRPFDETQGLQQVPGR